MDVHSCYMYTPVRPFVEEPNKGERRPLGIGWGFSGRSHAVKVAECEVVRIVGAKRTLTKYQVPLQGEALRVREERNREELRYVTRMREKLRAANRTTGEGEG